MKKHERDKKTVVDPVAHPPHYTSHPSGVEAIEITGNMNFPLGNAAKYILRRNHKGSLQQDLRKAIWYCNYTINQPKVDPDELTEKVVRVSYAENIRIGMAISNIFMANNTDNEEARIKLLASAIDLLESELATCCMTK